MIAAAASNAGTIEKSALRAAFAELENVSTEIGDVTFKGFGPLPNLPVHIMRIENGEGVHVRSIKLTADELPAPRSE